MDQFIDDLPAPIFSNLVKSVGVVTILLQLTTMASGSIGILPDLHHHPPPHHPPGFEYHSRWPKPQHHGRHHRRPVDVMTDVINDLGVKILDRYIEQNGNVGFSPSGLGFVLVALYEGSAGSSGRQIGDVLGLPSDRRITRIGLRDIHRRLRSYLNADAFLGGLTLNRDDINLRPEYEDVLRFYGFDISDSGNVTTTAAVSVNVTTGTLAASTLANTTDAMTMQITTQPSSVSPTTINDAVEIITNVAGDQSSALTMGSTSAAPSTANTAPTTIDGMSQAAIAPTTIDGMSQAAAVINAASTTITTTAATTTITTNAPTVPLTTTPTSTLTTVGSTSATTMASMMIMSIVQAIMNTMNGSTTTQPAQGSVGPPTVAADMQTQSSDGSTVSLGASSNDSAMATSPMTTVVTMPIVPMTNDTMMQRLVSATTQNSADMQAGSSDGSPVAVDNTVGNTNPMTPATSAMTGATTNPTNATSNPTTIPTMAAATNLTNSTTNPLAEATTNPTNDTTNPMILMREAPTDSMTDSTTGPTVPPITTVPTTPMTTMMTTLTTMPETMGDTDSVNETTMTTQMDNTMTTMAGDMMTNAVRKRRSVLQGPSGYFSSSADDSVWLDVFGRLNNNDDYQAQDEDILDNPNPTTQLDFLVNGCDYSTVTAATYTAVLPFAYFPSLRTSLLEFPLDDPRYKILVMLPSESNGTRRLARILATKSITLRHLRRSLQPTWVTAVIPSFMLRGFVTLTPYLQRLGISDVFEPRTADLSPMSPDLGVYARDIQQSIGVNIRNNMMGGIGGADGGNGDEQQQQQPQPANLARGTRGVVGLPPFFAAGGAISPRSLPNLHYSPYPGGAGPIPFVVDRPFLYFIVDDQTSVSLLTGRIDDPLNSRIML